MTIRTVLFVISLGLLTWLLVDNIFQIDIAATKNNGLTSMKKMEVDQLQTIDSVKSNAKTSLDIIRKNTKRNSELAIRRLWIIFALIAIHLTIWVRFRKLNRP